MAYEDFWDYPSDDTDIYNPTKENAAIQGAQPVVNMTPQGTQYNYPYGTYQQPKDTGTKATKTAESAAAGTISGGIQYKPPTGFTQTTMPVMPEGDFPVPGEIPKFNLPTRDEARIRRLTEETARPQVRALRRGTREALLRMHNDDPRYRMRMRDVMQNLALGLGSIYGGARTQAREQYEREFASQVHAADVNFSASMADWKARYEGSLKKYLAAIGQTTTKKNTYSSTGSSGGTGYKSKEVYGIGGYNSYSTPGAGLWG